MKDRIFPSWSEIEKLHNPLTEGERRLACFLDSVLPEEWKENENLDALIYTAITRTQKNLIVLNCNNRYRGFGETIKRA